MAEFVHGGVDDAGGFAADGTRVDGEAGIIVLKYDPSVHIQVVLDLL